MARGKHRVMRYASNILENTLCGVTYRRCCSNAPADLLESSVRQLSSFPGFAQCAASEVKQHPAAQNLVPSNRQGADSTGSTPWAGLALGLAASLLTASVVSCEAASPGSDKGKGGQYHKFRKAVEDLWMELEEDLSRDEAGLYIPPLYQQPPGWTARKSDVFRRRPAVVEELENGKFRVNFPVRPGVSPQAFIRSLRRNGWTVGEVEQRNQGSPSIGDEPSIFSVPKTRFEYDREPWRSFPGFAEADITAHRATSMVGARGLAEQRDMCVIFFPHGLLRFAAPFKCVMVASLPSRLVAEKQGVKIVLDVGPTDSRAATVSVEPLGFGPGDSEKQKQLALLREALRAANSIVEVEKDDKGRTIRSWSGAFSWSPDSYSSLWGDEGARWNSLEKDALDIWKSLMEEQERSLIESLSDLTSRMYEFSERQRYPGYSSSDEWTAMEPRRGDQAMGKPPDKPPVSKEEQQFGSAAAAAAAEKLTSLGCMVYPPHSEQGPTNWDSLAGYTEQKQAIEETVLLALREPDVYDDVARATREEFDSNRARAILFEGPPGCGKTTAARIIAGQASVPLVYVPTESFQSKWYGESEKNLAEIMKLAEEVGQPSNGSILFLDELDSLATSRDQQMHEATRRVLGVLLRSLDGFTRGRYIVIGATNRKQDLDLALRSRFSTSVFFQLPDTETREKIVGKYAKQLTTEERRRVASVTQGASGRDIKAFCEQAERRWASQIIKGQAPRGSAPSLDLYLAAAAERKMALEPIDPIDPSKSNYSVAWRA